MHDAAYDPRGMASAKSAQNAPYVELEKLSATTQDRLRELLEQIRGIGAVVAGAVPQAVTGRAEERIAPPSFYATGMLQRESAKHETIDAITSELRRIAEAFGLH